MSNTMRPTKPGTLSLTSRPAKRATANRSGRPTRSDGSAATSKPYQRDPAGSNPRGSDADRPARNATSGRPERSGSEGTGRPARGPGAGRANQAAKPGMKPRGAKPGNVSRGEKGDNAGSAASPRSTGFRSGGPAKDVASPARTTRPARTPAAPNTDRLAKRLAAELPCSRGDAERYIEGGWVTVDGKVQEEPGLRVGPSQAVSLMPGARLEEGRPVTVLVHKPAGMYADDQRGSALDLILPENLMPGDRSGQRYLKRMFNGLKLVTPLERAASGLVVYTQEYAVARKLVEEGRHVEQEYIAHVEGQLSEADLARMQRGMAYEGRAATPMKVSWQNESHLRFALKSPMPGFIEAVCEAAGLRLLALRRLRIGRLPMAGLAAGQWRYRLEYERF